MLMYANNLSGLSISADQVSVVQSRRLCEIATRSADHHRIARPTKAGRRAPTQVMCMMDVDA